MALSKFFVRFFSNGQSSIYVLTLFMIKMTPWWFFLVSWVNMKQNMKKYVLNNVLFFTNFDKRFQKTVEILSTCVAHILTKLFPSLSLPCTHNTSWSPKLFKNYLFKRKQTLVPYIIIYISYHMPIHIHTQTWVKS